MTDLSIVDRITSLQANQAKFQLQKNQMVAQLLDRHEMQIEDLHGHIWRL